VQALSWPRNGPGMGPEWILTGFQRLSNDSQVEDKTAAKPLRLPSRTLAAFHPISGRSRLRIPLGHQVEKGPVQWTGPFAWGCLKLRDSRHPVDFATHPRRARPNRAATQSPYRGNNPYAAVSSSGGSRCERRPRCSPTRERAQSVLSILSSRRRRARRVMPARVRNRAGTVLGAIV